MDDPTRRLEPYFRAVCIEIRERKDRSPAYVAHLTGLKEVSITRFEAGKTYPTKNFETYAAAYAALDDIDPRELLRRVIDYWLELGNAPLTPKQAERLSEAVDPFSAETVLRHISQAEQQSEKEREKAAKRPTSIRKKGGAGE